MQLLDMMTPHAAAGPTVQDRQEDLEFHLVWARLRRRLAFAQQAQVLLLAHAASGTAMEVTIAWLPFEREALASAERLPIAGVSPPVARAEDR